MVAVAEPADCAVSPGRRHDIVADAQLLDSDIALRSAEPRARGEADDGLAVGRGDGGGGVDGREQGGRRELTGADRDGDGERQAARRDAEVVDRLGHALGLAEADIGALEPCADESDEVGVDGDGGAREIHVAVDGDRRGAAGDIRARESVGHQCAGRRLTRTERLIDESLRHLRSPALSIASARNN